MSITQTTQVKFRFMAAADFGAKVTAGTLDAGSLYFVGSVIYLALSGSTYQSFGGSQIGAAPTNPNNAEVGVWYYEPTTGILNIAVRMKNGDHAETVQYITVTEAFSSIEYGSDGGIYFVQLNGDRIELELPVTDDIDSAEDHTLPTRKAVVDYVTEKIGGVLGGVRHQGGISPTVLPTSAKQGDLYRVKESFLFHGTELEPGDWVVFKIDATAPFTEGIHFDVFTGVENPAMDNLDSTSSVLPLAANQGRVLDEKITELDEAKIDKMVHGAAGEIVQSHADGTVFRSGMTFSTAGSIPSIGTASTTAVPNEAAIAASLANVAQSAVVNWLTD